MWRHIFISKVINWSFGLVLLKYFSLTLGKSKGFQLMRLVDFITTAQWSIFTQLTYVVNAIMMMFTLHYRHTGHEMCVIKLLATYLNKDVHNL